MKIYQKIFAIQSEIEAITKDSENPFFKSSYFDINKLIETLKPLLIKNKLIVIQPVISVDNKNILTTKIIDIESGEELQSTIELPNNLDPQKIGSAITYYRRYTLQSLLFLQAEDDDANQATSNKPKYPQTGTKTIQNPKVEIPF